MKEQPILTGVTDTTPQHLQLNAGVLLKKFQLGTDAINQDDIIGATRGGATFRAEPTIHHVEADGIPTNYKGMDRIDEWAVTLEATMLEFKPDIIKMALGAGVKETSETGYTKYTVTHEIDEATNYSDIWWIGALSNGKRVVIQIKNGLNKSGLSLTFADKGEGTIPLTLTGHYTYEDMQNGTAPFAIYYPTEE